MDAICWYFGHVGRSTLNRRTMPKKVSELFSNLFNKSRQTSATSSSCGANVGELTTDAAVLDDAYDAQLDEKKGVEVFEEPQTSDMSSAVAIASRRRLFSNPLPSGNDDNVSEEMSRSAGVVGCCDVEPYLMPGLDIVRDPAVGFGPPAMPMAVNNTQGYNVFQFSQISGLHIGSVYNITNEAAPEKAQSEMRPNRTDEPYRRTKTIEGKSSY